MNKVTVDNLIKEMVQILVTEVDTVINKSNLVFKHKTDKMTGQLIAKSIGKYGLEWSSDIIRDQVIATMYEAMLIVAKDFEAWDITFDNPAFMGRVYNLTELMLKKELISGSKKDSSGSIINLYEDPVSPLAEEGEAASQLEQLLNGSIDLFVNEEKANHFLTWFAANKKKILTKKQLQFINNELVDMDKTAACHLRKRIADRVIKAYEEAYGSLTTRQATLMDQQKTLEAILEADDLRAAIIPYMEEDYIIDAIMDNVSSEAAKAFNTGADDPETIKEYRIALFTALGDVIEVLEIEGM